MNVERAIQNLGCLVGTTITNANLPEIAMHVAYELNNAEGRNIDDAIDEYFRPLLEKADPESARAIMARVPSSVSKVFLADFVRQLQAKNGAK